MTSSLKLLIAPLLVALSISFSFPAVAENNPTNNSATSIRKNTKEPLKKSQSKSASVEEKSASVEPKTTSATAKGFIYGTGFAAIVAGFFCYSRSRRRVGSIPATGDQTQSFKEESNSEESNMILHNLSKKRRELMITRHLVSDANLTPESRRGVSKFGDEDEMKLKIARTYQELDRHEDAKTMLEEVISSGSITNRNKAKKLLGR